MLTCKRQQHHAVVCGAALCVAAAVPTLRDPPPRPLPLDASSAILLHTVDAQGFLLTQYVVLLEQHGVNYLLMALDRRVWLQTGSSVLLQPLSGKGCSSKSGVCQVKCGMVVSVLVRRSQKREQAQFSWLLQQAMVR
jgi:hypothetical protein